MKYLILSLILVASMSINVVFDFNKDSDISDWIIIDDIVMGGKSSGRFSLNDDGFGVFEGTVSLENNGGFSSVHYGFETIELKEKTKAVFKIKGDGKDYQFRLKGNSDDYFSYVTSFSTTGEWEEIEIPLKDMYPSFRGQKLPMSNFSGDQIEEIAFLISNKKAENFKLLIDKIELK